jgi:acetate kinase
VNAAPIILSLNSGSSTRNFSLSRITDKAEVLLAEGEIERLGTRSARMQVRDGKKKILSAKSNFPYPKAPLLKIFKALTDLKLPSPDAAGHRLVNGGPDHFAPERITARVTSELKRLIPFAPLHLPDEIRGIEETAAHYPSLPQVACFDTAFHHAMPEVARRFPVLRALWGQGLRRFGFHGISYEYIMQTLGHDAPSRIIIAHLGNGASMVAVRDGRPLETTMGFSPTGGFMMGTRSGDLDPGAILFLLKQKKLNPSKLESSKRRLRVARRFRHKFQHGDAIGADALRTACGTGSRNVLLSCAQADRRTDDRARRAGSSGFHRRHR